MTLDCLHVKSPPCSLVLPEPVDRAGLVLAVGRGGGGGGGGGRRHYRDNTDMSTFTESSTSR